MRLGYVYTHQPQKLHGSHHFIQLISSIIYKRGVSKWHTIENHPSNKEKIDYLKSLVA